jgi:hypothetical protein
MNIENVTLSSVPLHCLDKTMTPLGFGTGCIIESATCDYLFTVFHVAHKNIGKWSILCEYIPGTGSKYLQIDAGRFNFQSVFNVLTGLYFDVEFAFAEIPKEGYYYQEIIPPCSIIKQIERKKFRLAQINPPQIGIDYGFCGQIKPSIIPNYAIDTQNYCHLDYRFKETRDWIQVFTPPIQHPGHDFYHGCSGAPIIDDNDNIVSLLICGDIDANEIYGVNLQKAIIGFNINIGNV